MTDRESRELIQLWLLANEGELSEAQAAELDRRIAENHVDRRLLIHLAQQQGWLKWNAAGTDLVASLVADGQASEPFACGLPLASAARRGPFRVREYFGDAWKPTRVAQNLRRLGGHAGLAAALAIACFAGYLGGAGIWSDPPTAPGQSAGNPVQATIVSSTGCIWGTALPKKGGFPSMQRASDDSLQLLEGIAEFSVGARGDVRLQMEGPASVVLSSHDSASMSYGKIIVGSPTGNGGQFSIETPLGRIQVSEDSEVGVIAFGSIAEVHCFRGRVEIESPWLLSDEVETASSELSMGQSFLVQNIGLTVLQVHRQDADKRKFTPQVAMNNDFLSVGADYVRTIIDAAPIAYWRFEEVESGEVLNEMGPNFAGRIKGEVGWEGPRGNRVISMGLNGKQGSVLSDDSWDETLQGDFSIELWMKPSHHHLGSMVGFVGDFDPELQRNRHGVLLETCGPVVNVFHWLKPKRIRFLHRSELTASPKDGVDCFSADAYDVRRWQHVVATKQGDQLRLYIDGKLAAAQIDDQPTPRGLHLVIGQLYTETLERFFIGQLDEIAVYDRALPEDEVKAHHELLRPVELLDPAVL